jgi:threonine aldolase
MAPVDTCMVFYDPSPLGVEYAEVAERAAELERPLGVAGSRLVVRSNTPLSNATGICF